MGRPSKQVLNICKRCNKEFLFKQSQENSYTNAGSFCSRRCHFGKFSYICKGCKKSFDDGYVAHQKYCSEKCKYKAKDNNPIRKKAFTMSSFITFGGKGKLDYFEGFLKQQINTPCGYCDTLLTLENVSLDHIEPFASTQARKNPAIKRQLDRKENLQIICRTCNQTKGTLSHPKYIKLLNFLQSDPEIYNYVMKKLKQSKIMFTHSRNTR